MKLVLAILIFYLFNSFSQDNDSCNYVKFYHKNGNISSEGCLYNGKPDGIWKSYYENGNIKSIGNRNNYLLDSLWSFYDIYGKLISTINYKNGLKNGDEKYYKNSKLLKLYNYKNSIRQGDFKSYYQSSNIKSEAKYLNGKLDGFYYTYSDDEEGRIIRIRDYNKGYLSSDRIINSYEKGKKNGYWAWFYDNNILKREGYFDNGFKNGFFKYYDVGGELIKIEIYVNDTLKKNDLKSKPLQVKREYYSNGNLKSYNSYRSSKLDGIQKEFDQYGKMTNISIYKYGLLIEKGGYLDDYSNKQGFWVEYYFSGEKKSEGNYVDNKKNGEWKFFYKNKNLENKITFLYGKPNGYSVWYYENGNILREENYEDGVKNGEFKEYDKYSKIIIEGNYYYGYKQGLWKYKLNDYRDEGEYQDGKKNGIWNSYFLLKNDNDKSILMSECNYYIGYLQGKCYEYHSNGRIKIMGNYLNGKKEGLWKYYDENGIRIINIMYKDGIDLKYNNVETIDLN